MDTSACMSSVAFLGKTQHCYFVYAYHSLCTSFDLNEIKYESTNCSICLDGKDCLKFTINIFISNNYEVFN